MSHSYRGRCPEPEAVEDRGCCSTLWNACSKTYTPSVLTLLIYLLATAIIIVAMIFDDITIPRLITGIVGMIVYTVVPFSVYFDFVRDNHMQPTGNQDIFIARTKKFFFAKVKYHAIITWLAIVMVVTTPIVDDDILAVELIATFGLMGAVMIIGASVEPPEQGVHV